MNGQICPHPRYHPDIRHDRKTGTNPLRRSSYQVMFRFLAAVVSASVIAWCPSPADASTVPPVEPQWIAYVTAEHEEPILPACVPIDIELAACYALFSTGDGLVSGLGSFQSGVWVFTSQVYEPAAEVEPVSVYPSEDDLRVIVEEWREENRPDLEFEPMFEVAVTCCTDETDPMILAMLIDNGDIAGNLLDFLTDVCPQVIAAADAVL